MHRRHPLFAIFTLAVVVASVRLTASRNVCWLTVTYGADSDGGMYVYDVDTPEACYSYCISSSDSCQAVDFVVAFSQCWWHPSNLLMKPDSRSIERYEYTCNHDADCTDSFEQFVDIAPLDPTTGEIRQISEEDCKLACLQDSNCRSVLSYVNPSDGIYLCCLYKSWSGDAAQIVSSPSAVMYLRKSCLQNNVISDEVDQETEHNNDTETEQGGDDGQIDTDGNHGVNRSGDGKPIVDTGGSSEPEKQENPASSCWLTVTYGANSNAGDVVNGVDNEKDCYKYCISHSDNCQAVEYVVAEHLCYSHPNTLDLLASSRCIRYHYTCYHDGSCTDSFEETFDQAPTDPSVGRQQDSVQSEDDCKARCLADADCLRYTFDYAFDYVCRLYTTWNDTLAESLGAVIYLRMHCLQVDPQPDSSNPDAPEDNNQGEPAVGRGQSISDTGASSEPEKQINPGNVAPVFRLQHEEYETMYVDVDGDPSDSDRQPAAGKALVTRWEFGLRFYTDDSGRIRSHSGDFCVTEGIDNVLVLGACDDSTSDQWRYVDGIGLVKGSAADASSFIAVWNDKKEAKTPSGSRLIARPFSVFSNSFGAEWISVLFVE